LLDPTRAADDLDPTSLAGDADLEDEEGSRLLPSTVVHSGAGEREMVAPPFTQ
jgi:hypothetical protein